MAHKGLLGTMACLKKVVRRGGAWAMPRCAWGGPKPRRTARRASRLASFMALVHSPLRRLKVATACKRTLALERYRASTKTAVMRVWLDAVNRMGSRIPAACPMES